MNVRNVIENIHSRIEKEAGDSSIPGHRLLLPPAEFLPLRNAVERMHRSRNLVGTMPPCPDTFRARAGGYLVRFVQRLLFWYTPQIRRFQDETTQALGAVWTILQQQQQQIAELQKETKRLRVPESAVRPQSGGACPVSPPGFPQEFEFALQDHFRGSEPHTREKLRDWIVRIRRVLIPVKGTQSDWLDFGCGRGEWLGLLRDAGQPGQGIDTNPLYIEHCRAQGLKAEQHEGLRYLRGCPDASLTVITAFHVIEHLPADQVLEFLLLAQGKLRPGGLLVLETPNPANLQMSAHHFWKDPTHVRPIPLDFLEFTLRYIGLEVATKVDLNPAPPEQHLPYAEIDLVRQVDHHLYGPQDYGIIARRP